MQIYFNKKIYKVFYKTYKYNCYICFMSSKQKQNIDTRRVKVFKMLILSNKPIDLFAQQAAKKTGVSKVTIYNDLRYIRNNMDYFNSKLD